MIQASNEQIFSYQDLHLDQGISKGFFINALINNMTGLGIGGGMLYLRALVYLLFSI